LRPGSTKVFGNESSKAHKEHREARTNKGTSMKRAKESSEIRTRSIFKSKLETGRTGRCTPTVISGVPPPGRGHPHTQEITLYLPEARASQGRSFADNLPTSSSFHHASTETPSRETPRFPWATQHYFSSVRWSFGHVPIARARASSVGGWPGTFAKWISSPLSPDFDSPLLSLQQTLKLELSSSGRS
jgi:hypothetical protein